MNPIIRKALVGLGLAGATLTGGAIGAAMLSGTASAQTTTTVPSDNSGGGATTPTKDGNCPHDGTAPAQTPSTSNSSSSTAPAT